MEAILNRSAAVSTSRLATTGALPTSSCSSGRCRKTTSLSSAASASLLSTSPCCSYVSQSIGVAANSVLGVQLPRRVSRRKLQRCMAISEVVGEANIPPNVRKVKETKVVIMVDPVEAKRLAAIEMKAIQARNKFKRQREIEATNGSWAVLGLTIGMIIEGYTGKGILVQIAGCLDNLADFLTQLSPAGIQ